MNRNESRSHLAAALAAALFATAGAAHAADPGDAPKPEFTRLDANHDGYLSRAEAAKLRDFDKAFAEADDNHDGRLDAAEFVKAQSVQERLRAAQFVDDSVITAKVKAALIKDSLMKALDVSVETHKGIVLLSGFVQTEQQARRAGELAAAVGGVVSVKNSLVVNS